MLSSLASIPISSFFCEAGTDHIHSPSQSECPRLLKGSLNKSQSGHFVRRFGLNALVFRFQRSLSIRCVELHFHSLYSDSISESVEPVIAVLFFCLSDKRSYVFFDSRYSSVDVQVEILNFHLNKCLLRKYQSPNEVTEWCLS